MNFKQYIKENADERERVFEKLQGKTFVTPKVPKGNIPTSIFGNRLDVNGIKIHIAIKPQVIPVVKIKDIWPIVGSYGKAALMYKVGFSLRGLDIIEFVDLIDLRIAKYEITDVYHCDSKWRDMNKLEIDGPDSKLINYAAHTTINKGIDILFNIYKDIQNGKDGQDLFDYNAALVNFVKLGIIPSIQEGVGTEIRNIWDTN